jgi:ribosomal protein S18 acetylase RimI-like enzyme
MQCRKFAAKTDAAPQPPRKTQAGSTAREAMDNIAVRDARDGEAGFIVQMIRNMVTDMAGYGGNAPATDNAAWEKIAATIADELRGTGAKYVIAETAGGDAVGVGGAELITLGGAFAPKKTLHITAVYVLPQFRRGGIGSALLTRLLDWGRATGGEQCDLNVLNSSPAKSLYERHGFSVLGLKMVRSF